MFIIVTELSFSMAPLRSMPFASYYAACYFMAATPKNPDIKRQFIMNVETGEIFM